MPMETDISQYTKFRSYLFPSSCITVTTCEGRVFVIGGRDKHKFLKINMEIIIDKFIKKFGD